MKTPEQWAEEIRKRNDPEVYLDTETIAAIQADACQSADTKRAWLESEYNRMNRALQAGHTQLTEATRLLHQEGENSLLESAVNRMQELEILNDRASALYNGLVKVKESYGTTDYYLPPAELDALLVIHTTDSVWLEKNRYTLGLLRAARCHLPNSAAVGSLANAIDRQIEKMEKLIPRDTQSE